MDKEIKSLTGIRGVAALWVVLLHFIYVPNYNTENIFMDAGNQFLKKGNLGVDMFFMLSAFVMCLAYQKVFTIKFSFNDIKDYFLKRFVRIYPAYAFWVLLAAFVYKKWSFEIIGVNLLLSQSFFDPEKYSIGAVFWSLCAEWWMYMIFPFVYYLLSGLNSKGGVYLVLVVIASLVGLYLLPSLNILYLDFNGVSVKDYDHQFSVILGVNSLVRCVFCYFIGMSLFLFIGREGSKFDKILVPKSIYLILGAILMLSLFRKTEIFIVMCFALLIMSLYINKNSGNLFSNRIIYFLGLISYSLYLLHTTLRFIITVLVMKIFKVPVESADLPSMLLALVLVIPLSYLSYIHIEKKSGHWLKSKLFAVKPGIAGSMVQDASKQFVK